MKEKIRIKFLKDYEEVKKGEILLATKDIFTKGLMDDGIIELIDEGRFQEAKFYRDKSVLETGKNKQLSKEGARRALKVSEKNYERIVEKKYNLKDLYKIYQQNLYLEETDRIDIVLATALSKKLEGIPIWMILVGASGDMKSVQLNALEGFETYYLQKMTSKTLVNGFQDKKKHPDLAPKLRDKLLIIRDLATLMKLPPSEKAEIWGQLRDLYDGFAGVTSGMGTDIQYSDIKVSLLAASTPAIDAQILIHQDLGTRESIYRLEGNNKKDDVMSKCMENEELEEKIKGELKEVTLGFLNNCEIERFELNDEEIFELKEMAIYISHMRATASVDGYTNTLLTDVTPEEPTRIIKQLKRLYISLRSLDEDYPQEKAMRILWKVAKSSAFQMRVKVLDLLIKQKEEISTSKIADTLKIGKGTAQRELNILWNMNFVTCKKEKTNFPDRTYDYWVLNNENPHVTKLIETVRGYNT